jgi:hypothetical protein
MKVKSEKNFETVEFKYKFDELIWIIWWIFGLGPEVTEIILVISGGWGDKS